MKPVSKTAYYCCGVRMTDAESRRPLLDKLGPLRTERFCVFLFEGVFMYLEPEVIGQTLRTLRQLFPRHELVCDLMQRAFIDRRSASVRAKVERLGAIIRVGDQPEAPLSAQGYRRIVRTSVVGRSMELTLPGWLVGLTTLLPHDLVEGYWVGVYRPDLPAG